MRFIHYFAALSISFISISNSCEPENSSSELSDKPISQIEEQEEAKPNKLSFRFAASTSDKWKVVDSLERLGLYRSALDVVQSIYESELAEDNIPQVVKATMYKMKYNTYLEEDDFVKALHELDELSKSQVFPLKQIVKSISAEAYWSYYQSNRWLFMNRTETVNFEQSDVRTWDLNKILDYSRTQFLGSLENPDSLLATDINDFKDMLIMRESGIAVRPTLFDFLAHRALDLMSNDEAGLTKSMDHFHMEGPVYFSDEATFAAANPTSGKEETNLTMALKIYRVLTAAHLKDATPEARIDLLLRRLRFARTHVVDNNKDELYHSALESALEKFKSHEQAAEIAYASASYLNELGNKYDYENEDYRWHKKKALNLCEEYAKKFPKTIGGDQCKSLGLTIQQKELSLTAEEAYQNGTKNKFLVQYRNLDSLYFKLVEVSPTYFLNNELYGRQLIENLLSQKSIKKWNTILVDPKDYQRHTCELPLQIESKGHYVLLASPRADFDLAGNAVSYTEIWASDIAYTYRNTENQDIELIVSNRQTGEPISGAKVTTMIRKYDYILRKYNLKDQETYTSDKNGMMTIKSKSDYRNIYIDIEKSGDRYNNAHQLYQYKPYKGNEVYSTTNYFTDRAIYRPGQTLFFKGIAIKHNSRLNTHDIETNKSVEVKLYDVNGQVVSTKSVKTNEFGTFSGEFELPEGLLNGTMRIQDPHGSRWFSVEEYKRPRFAVKILPAAGEYRLNDSITITGNAQAFAGSTVDGAKVSYRITRGCYFPYWGWYRGSYPHVANVQVDYGSIETDEKGDFSIRFKAKDDPSIKASYKPTYTYTIHVDVTDINGETRSSSGYVSVGYNCLNLKLGIPDSYDKQDKSKFKITSTNLNGVDLVSKGNITIQRVDESKRKLLSSLWARPDIQTFSQEEFNRDFPLEEFGKDETRIDKLPLSEVISNLNFDTEKSDSIEIPALKTLKPGKYKIVCSAIDPFGVQVEDVQYITVIDSKSDLNPSKELLLITSRKVMGEPGQTAEVLLSSAVKIKVLYELEHQGTIVKREWIELNNSQKAIRELIEEKHRGNFTLHFHSIVHGRMTTQRVEIYVPYTNKALDVEIETFRDKLQPGEKEKWRVTIKGSKGEKVAAEMLAAMYDASLDEFMGNYFSMNVFQNYYSSRYWGSNSFGTSNSQLVQENWYAHHAIPWRDYIQLNTFGFGGFYNSYGYYSRNQRYYDSMDNDAYYDSPMMLEEAETEGFGFAAGNIADESVTRLASQTVALNGKAEMDDRKEQKNSDKDYRGDMNGQAPMGGAGSFDNVQVRRNFNETAFFYPQLKTNEKGEVVIEFTAPESLTKWKILGLAHTKDLKTGYLSKELVTQKELMILSNAPRFLREGDELHFSAKISNLSEKDLNGEAKLVLIDPSTDKIISESFLSASELQNFEVKKGQSTSVSWILKVPFGESMVKYKILAKAGNFSDGEEMILPILSNRMLVTESLPLPVRGTETKNFRFEKLINSGQSSTLKHHKLTLEYTANPAWYAVQAMPYMMEYPYECAEQVFTRYYANAIASEIMNSNPKIKEVFESWANETPESLLSNLEKNQELKSLLLEETPWVFEANDESERKKRLGLLLDLQKMNRELTKAMRKLEQMQVANGGWPWFKGMEESRYITQHVVTGMGHLDVLGVKNVREDNSVWRMTTKAVHYLDARIKEDYDWIRKHHPNYKTEQHISETQVQYLYARSYFKDVEIPSSSKEAITYFEEQAAKYWTKFNLYNEGMIALWAHRDEQAVLAKQVMASLKERAIEHDEFGMYWKDNISGYYWYNAPIETQALLIEAFDEVTDDQQTVEALKIWLLKQKQTTDWKTTKATAEACYALLRRGTDLLTNSNSFEIRLGEVKIDEKSPRVQAEAGTGYFKTSWEPEEIKPEMGNVSISRQGEGVSWGALYWQYFEDLDKITPHETPLSLKQELFKLKQTNSGNVIEPISVSTPLKTGDRIKVRIELRSDRNMEYLHLKDMRASGFEPVNVFSGYRWQGGLSYYESTKDAATNFFIEYLPKGVYVFEYELVVSHAGNFSNGISSIQCMYAPEFTSHSKGIRVQVMDEKK